MSSPVQPRPSSQLQGLSLRAKALISVGGCLIVAIVALGVVVSSLTMETFSAVQRNLSELRASRAIAQIDLLGQDLTWHVRSGASSGAAFSYLEKTSAATLRKIAAFQMSTLPSDFLVVFDRHKNVAGELFVDSAGMLVDGLPKGIAEQSFRGSSLLASGGGEPVLFSSPDGIWLISSSEIVRADGSGPSPGWVVFGISISPSRLKLIESTTAVVLEAVGTDVETPEILGFSAPTEQRTKFVGRCRVYRANSDGVDSMTRPFLLSFENALKAGPAQFVVNITPTVYQAALAFRDHLLLIIILGGAFLIIVCLSLVEWLFVRPVSEMDRGFQQISATGNSGARLPVTGSDEFTRMAQSANRLLDSLRRRRGEIDQQQKLLGGVLDSATEGIMAFRPVKGDNDEIRDFTIVVANPAAAQIVGKSTTEMIGTTLLATFSDNHDAWLFDRYVRVVQDGRADAYEYCHDEGELRRWFSSAAAPWNDGFVVTFEEITERKNAEEQLTLQLEELERFNRAMIGREERVLEMKREVNTLRKKLGLPPRYNEEVSDDGL